MNASDEHSRTAPEPQDTAGAFPAHKGRSKSGIWSQTRPNFYTFPWALGAAGPILHASLHALPQPCLGTAAQPAGRSTSSSSTTSLTINRNQQTAVCTEFCRAGGTKALGRKEHLLGTEGGPRLRPSAEPSRAGLLPPPADRPAALTSSQPRGAGRLRPLCEPPESSPPSPQRLAAPSLPARLPLPRRPAHGRPAAQQPHLRRPRGRRGAGRCRCQHGVLVAAVSPRPAASLWGSHFCFYPGRGGPRDPGGYLLVRRGGRAALPDRVPVRRRPRPLSARGAGAVPPPCCPLALSCPLRWERAAAAPWEAPVRSRDGLSAGVINLSTE